MPVLILADMRPNRLKELRQARGWSVRELAEKAGISHSYIVRIESGERGLSVDMAEKLGNALDVGPQQVLGLELDDGACTRHFGLRDEAEPFEIGPTAPITLRATARENVVPYEVNTASLDALGYTPGDVVFVNISQAAVDALTPGQCVLVQAYDGMTAKTIIRQFIAPALLITNSRTENAIPLRIDADDVAIKGVVIGTFRPSRT